MSTQFIEQDKAETEGGNTFSLGRWQTEPAPTVDAVAIDVSIGDSIGRTYDVLGSVAWPDDMTLVAIEHIERSAAVGYVRLTFAKLGDA